MNKKNIFSKKSQVGEKLDYLYILESAKSLKNSEEKFGGGFHTLNSKPRFLSINQ